MQLLTFFLDGERYALPIAQVREVMRTPRITRILANPPHLPGMIEVRGVVTPLLDLRIRLGLPVAPDIANSRVILVEIHEREHLRVVGLLVDAVAGVLNLTRDDLQPMPDLLTEEARRCFLGMGQQGDAFLYILALNQIVGVGSPPGGGQPHG